MDKEALRALCLSFPHATEEVQWGNDLLFKVGGKMFAITNLEPAEIRGLSLKTTPELFGELIEREGIKPSAYIGRYHWIHISDLGVLKPKELTTLVQASYDLVFAKLPARLRRELAQGGEGRSA